MSPMWEQRRSLYHLLLCKRYSSFSVDSSSHLVLLSLKPFRNFTDPTLEALNSICYRC